MDKPVCPSCGNKEKIVWSYKSLNKIENLLKCNGCGLYFVWPGPALGENKQIYEKEYFDAWSLKEIGLEGITKIKRATSERVLETVFRYKTKGSLLDVGCAFGHLLEIARERQWDVYGVEISEYAAKEARNKIGLNKIWIGDFLNLTLPDTTFDVITMIDVIEHTYDVNMLFKKCRGLLKDKGVLAMVTPDIGSFSRRMLNKRWPHFNKEHVIYFSSKNMSKILDINGFNVLESRNFKKAFNLYYIKSQVDAHCTPLLKFLINVGYTLTPKLLKKMNFFMSHGEMLVIAQKK